MPAHREIEVKCRISDIAAFRRKLTKLKAQAILPSSVFGNNKRKPSGKSLRVHELNLLFDTPESGFAKHGQLLRIRVASEESGGTKGLAQPPRQVLRALFTYKGPSFAANSTSQLPEQLAAGGGRTHLVTAGRHKVREEIEVEIASAADLKQILEALGMRAWFRYERFRTTFRLPASLRWAKDLLIEVDETPIGTFVELEGPRDSIDRAAELLGYSPRDYIAQSYLALYLEQCRVRKLPPGDMLFTIQK
jgi:adenylate cyclase class IV